MGYGAYVDNVKLEKWTDIEDDHGDYYFSATPISLYTNVPGDIEVAGDVDLFKFNATAGNEYIIETTLYSLVNSYIFLYDTDGTTIIAFDVNSGQGLASKITWTCTSSGYYYVEVGGYGSSQTGTYALRVTGSSAQQLPAMTWVGLLVTLLFVLALGAVRIRNTHKV